MDFTDYDNEGDVWTYVLIEKRGVFWKVIRVSDCGEIGIRTLAYDVVDTWYWAQGKVKRIVRVA